MKLTHLKVKENKVRYVNPQLFGNCRVEYIILVHLQNLKLHYGDINKELDMCIIGYTINKIGRHILNLFNTYGYSNVISCIEYLRNTKQI